MTRQYDQREPRPYGETVASGDHISVETVSGGQVQIGHGNVLNQGVVPHAPGVAGRPRREMDGSPVSSLYAFGDIVGYSRFNAKLQEESQDRLVRVLNDSLAEAGVDPETVEAQNQGDARLLRFRVDTDVAKIVAIMPRYLNGDLLARNQDMAPHARLRVRLSFTMGATTPGRTGLAGQAPIAVVRLANSARFRQAMNAVPNSQCGVIIDNYLYGEYVRQDFRPDMNPEEYTPVRVSDSEKSFEAGAWIRLFGCSPEEVRALIG